jgi:hypothetical protein
VKQQTWSVIKMDTLQVTQVEAVDSQDAVLKVYIELYGYMAAKSASVRIMRDCTMAGEDRPLLVAYHDNRPVPTA